MENIDLTKCNNLRYKAKIDGNDDHGRICVENADTGLAFLRSDKEDEYVGVWHCDETSIKGISGREVTGFEIVPRDPETYQDWQVGDLIVNRDGCTGQIIFRSGDFVAADIDGCRCYTCKGRLFDDGYRLVLTDIEQRIIGEKKVVEDIPKPYEFKTGEPVLVRDYGGFWKIGVFTKMQDSHCKYMATTDGVDECGYRQCIPYNERTMHLLGTTEDYKEGE